MVFPVDIFYGQKLKKLREDRFLKQFAVAEILGIAQQEYSNLEVGRRNFNVDLIKRIVAGFGIVTTKIAQRGPEFWFNPEVFKAVSAADVTHRSIEILNLYFTTTYLEQALMQTEQQIEKALGELMPGAESLNTTDVIRIGYLS